LNRKAASALLIFAVIVAFGIFPAPSSANDQILSVDAQSAILMNMNTGKVLYAQNPDDHIQPASLTKVLSLYLVHEAIRDGKTSMAAHVKVSRRAMKCEGSRMFLKRGQRVHLDDLVKGMAIVSGNDASIAAAEHIGGNVPQFVKEMNVKAAKLGMQDSHFMNPNGLPAKGQYTTARDIMILSHAYLRDFSESLEVHSMPDYKFGRRVMHNHNRLIRKDESVDGLKTGFVRAAGFHIVATAKRDNVRLIAVVMGARSISVRDRETIRLLEEGFKMTQREPLEKKTRPA